MKKRIIMIAAAAALSVLMAFPAFAGTWKDVNGRWRYQRGAEKYASQEWLNLDGKRYYIGSDGFMVTGWTQVGSQWYYMDESGVLQYGWLKDNDKWYYLAPDTGAMVTDTVIDGRQIGSDGVWVPAEAQTEPVGLAIDPASATLVQNMEGIKTNGYTIISSGRTFNRENWNDAIRLVKKGSYVKCSPGGNYKLLSGTFSPSTKFDSGLLGKLTVYGDDDQVLYTSADIHYDAQPITFAVDVSGQNQLRVEFSLTKDDNWSEPVLLIKGLTLYQ